VSVHGVLAPPQLGPQADIQASILLLHGWEDPFAPPAHIETFAREFTDAKADWQVHAYGHAMHAFSFERAAKPEQGIAYDAAAARRSWQAMQDFFGEIFAAPRAGVALDSVKDRAELRVLRQGPGVRRDACLPKHLSNALSARTAVFDRPRLLARPSPRSRGASGISRRRRSASRLHASNRDAGPS
jgi:hypothetical protein